MPGNELTDLLREMASRVTVVLPELCGMAEQALALAEEQERQLAAAQAALKQIAEHPHVNYDHPSNGPGPYGIGTADGHRCAAVLARDALANGTAALDAHDERVRRETLEAAADNLEIIKLHPDAKRYVPYLQVWLREGARATQ